MPDAKPREKSRPHLGSVILVKAVKEPRDVSPATINPFTSASFILIDIRSHRRIYVLYQFILVRGIVEAFELSSTLKE
jgi:hypothetical protein